MATEAQGNPGTRRFGPSDSLLAVFRACSRDPTRAVEERLRRMLHSFLQHNRDKAEDRTTTELCCRQAVTWYYRILEALINHGKKRLGTVDGSSFFENNLVQCCLVTCCLEITICLNYLPSDFPLLLQLFNLAPYHVWRAIVLIVQRTQDTLPLAAVGHLTQLCLEVLESLAWSGDSPLWDDIRANEEHLPTCQQVFPPTQLEVPKRTEMNNDRNPPGVVARLGADIAPQCSPSASNRPRRSDPLRLFAQKVYSLMGKRLTELCSVLNVCDDLHLKIWTCFEHSLVHCTRLMMDHHLDQMLMCAIYIMAKITKMEIPFKHIMKCYKSLPHADQRVYKNVLIAERGGDEAPTETLNDTGHSAGFLSPSTPTARYPAPYRQQRGNLIYFYNQVYTMKMQNFIKSFASTAGGETPPLSTYPQQKKAPPRRHRLSSSHSIFVSLYKPETVPRLTSGLSYVFSSSPSERLREINNMIKTGRSLQRSGRAASGDDGPIAKRLRQGHQSAWQRRLRNVVNERVTRRKQEQKSPVKKL